MDQRDPMEELLGRMRPRGLSDGVVRRIADQLDQPARLSSRREWTVTWPAVAAMFFLGVGVVWLGWLNSANVPAPAVSKVDAARSALAAKPGADASAQGQVTVGPAWNLSPEGFDNLMARLDRDYSLADSFFFKPSDGALP